MKQKVPNISEDYLLIIMLLYFEEKEVFYRKINAHFVENGLVIRDLRLLQDAEDTVLMAQSKEELKSLLMKVEEESENAGLKFNFQKTSIMVSSPITWLSCGWIPSLTQWTWVCANLGREWRTGKTGLLQFMS